MINYDLARDRNLDMSTICEIDRLHARRELIFSKMRECRGESCKDLLKNWDKELDLIEEDLQVLWGFTKDKNFIKFWYRPWCSCPKIDNDDNYPHGYYNINQDCILHGV